MYNLNTAANRGISYRLLELGFITNSGDRQKTIGNMDSLARKLAEAIINRKLSAAPAQAVPTPSGSSSSATFHTVVSGDTLYSLSRRYGSTVNQIKTWNNLTSDTIVIGQRLRVTSGSSSQSPQANLSQNYYTTNPQRVRLLVRAGLYGINDVGFTGGHVGGTYNAGTIFVIRGIKHSASGIPRLITQSNFLLTANRQYVVKH